MHLVTLAGVGGGKTRLAVQVAADLSDVFDDGVFLVPLAPISDPHLVTSTIAQTLDILESGGRPLLESLKEALQHKQILLLLDNFEQVVGRTGRRRPAGGGTPTQGSSNKPRAPLRVQCLAPSSLSRRWRCPISSTCLHWSN